MENKKESPDSAASLDRFEWAQQKFGERKNAEHLPQAHRCNDRAEDLTLALVHGHTSAVMPTLALLVRCVASSPGHEPTDAFKLLKPQDGHTADSSPHSHYEQPSRSG